MRLRVVGVLSLFSLLIVAAVAVSILTTMGRELTQEVQISRVAALDHFARLGYDSATSGDSTGLQLEMDRYSQLYGEGMVIRLPQGTLRSGDLSADRPDVAHALARAQLNLSDTALAPLQPFGSGTEVLFRPFGSASQVLGEAALDVHLDTARRRLARGWLVVLLVALLVWLALVVGAMWVTRWILRPVHRLTGAVTELEHAGRTADLPDAGPPELRVLSRAFSGMAQTVTASLEAQRQFVADASHQLRNPVGALRLRLDLLQLDLTDRGEAGLAAAAVKDLGRVEEILDGLLRLAAAEHRATQHEAGQTEAGQGEALDDLDGGRETARDLIDPGPVLEEAVDRATPRAQEAGVAITYAAASGPATWVACLATDLADMVDEAIGNALKYAPGAHVTVSARTAGDVVHIDVADDGPGLSADERAAAATRFWRSPHHENVTGTGLGMAIVERLAVANGGRLVLLDNAPHGLVVRLELPGQPSESHAGGSDAS